MFPEIYEQMDEIQRGVVDVLPEDELVKKLEHSKTTNTPLIIKLGCDPYRQVRNSLCVDRRAS